MWMTKMPIQGTDIIHSFYKPWNCLPSPDYYLCEMIRRMNCCITVAGSQNLLVHFHNRLIYLVSYHRKLYRIFRFVMSWAHTVKNLPGMRETWVKKIPWRREGLSNPIFLIGEFHRQRLLSMGVTKSQTWLSYWYFLFTFKFEVEIYLTMWLVNQWKYLIKIPLWELEGRHAIVSSKKNGQSKASGFLCWALNLYQQLTQHERFAFFDQSWW